MRVLLVRHGHAVDESGQLADDDRYLDAKGRRAVHEVAQGLLDQHVLPAHIVTSPLVRAVQTAEIIAQTLGFQGEVRVSRALVPGGRSVERALASVTHVGANDTLFLVGHEPLMHAMAAHLLGETRFPPFPKAGACLFEFGPSARHGQFQWMLVPRPMKLLRRIEDIQ